MSTSASNQEYTITRKGEVFDISREANPSTGYSWVATTSKGLKIIHSEVLEGRLPGLPGSQVWTIRATGKGKQWLKATYKRSWEAVTADALHYTLNVLVI